MSEKYFKKRSINALIEHFSDNSSLAKISRAFGLADIGPKDDYKSAYSTERRALVDEHLASLDLTDVEDAKRLLALYVNIISDLQLEIEKGEDRGWDTTKDQEAQRILLNALRGDGYEYRDGQAFSIQPLTAVVTGEAPALINATNAPMPSSTHRTEQSEIEVQTRASLEAQFDLRGIDQIEADEPHDFVNVVGPSPVHRGWAREWLSLARETRDRTAELRKLPPKAIRATIVKFLYEKTDGDTSGGVEYTDFAKDIRLEVGMVTKAFDYLENEHWVWRSGPDTYALTHVGVKAAEQIMQEMKHLRSDGEKSPRGNGVFIGHGRNPLWLHVKSFLADDFGIQAHTFERHKLAGKTVIGTLQQIVDLCDFAIIVATGEDSTENGVRARQNVVHEIGLFQGRLGFDKVAVLLQRGTESYSNLSGLLTIDFDGDDIERTFNELSKALRNAGHPQP